MIGLLFLIGSFLLGVGLIRVVFPFTNGAERLFWGSAIGVCVSTWTCYIVSRSLGQLNFAAIVVLTAGICMLGVFLCRGIIASLRRNNYIGIINRNRPLIIALLLVLPIFLYFFKAGMFRIEHGEMILTLTSWYDLALHLAIANSFVYGDNFPPMYMVLPDEPLRYPFLPDFHAAILLKLGWSIYGTFAVTSFLAAFSLVGTFFCFARRLANSTRAAFVATLLFFFNGGLGFLVFIRDWYVSGQAVNQLLDPQQNYTDYWGQGLKWANIITSGVIPQRAMLYGMSIAFVILALIAIVWKNWSSSKVTDLWAEGRTLFAAGVLTGLLPLFHIHSYMAIGMITGFLFLLRPRAAWLIFWAPAVLLALPQVFGAAGGPPASEFLQYHLGWMSYTGGNFFLFLLMNFGLPLLIVVPALVKAEPHIRTFYVAFAAVMIFCFFFRVSPNDFDNLKLMYYWHAATAVVVGLWLARMSARPRLWVAAAVMLFICVISGVLAVVREGKLVHAIFSADEIKAGEFVRDNIEPTALFLTGQYHNQPALCLGGKRIFLGYNFWITSHGYSNKVFEDLQNDVKSIYGGGAEAESLLAARKIDYVYIGPHEIQELNANRSYFDTRYPRVFRNASITIYKVTK